MKTLLRTAFSILSMLATASPGWAQATSGSLDTQFSQAWSTAPWIITSGPGTFPDGGGVATLREQVNTEVGVPPDLTSVVLDVPVTLAGLNLRGPFGWRIVTSPGGSLTLDSSGMTVDAESPGPHVITSPMSGGGAAGLTKTGDGSVTLSASNTNTGGTHINGGVLEVTTGDAALGATGAGNGVSMDGGVLRLSGFNAFTTSRDVNIGAGGGVIENLLNNSNATFNGAIGGAGDFIYSGSSNVTTFTADNPLTGTLTFASPNVLTNLSGVSGAFRSATAYDFVAATLAHLDNSGANNNDRLSDTALITTAGYAAIFLTGNSAVPTMENVGPLHVAGTTRVAVRADSGQQSNINFASINRRNNAPLFIAGTNLGAPPAPFVAQITAATAPSPLTGGGGAPGSTNMNILPWATGKNSTAGADAGSTHVTYDPGNGRLRALSVAEYAPAFEGIATNNVRLRADTVAPAATTVNALLISPSDSVTVSGGPINVTSGSVVYSPTSFLEQSQVSTVSAGLNFGAAEGIIHTTADVEFSGPITGSGGLTISPRGARSLSAARTHTRARQISSKEWFSLRVTSQMMARQTRLASVRRRSFCTQERIWCPLDKERTNSVKA